MAVAPVSVILLSHNSKLTSCVDARFVFKSPKCRKEYVEERRGRRDILRVVAHFHPQVHYLEVKIAVN
jgi:hypothetical protein